MPRVVSVWTRIWRYFSQGPAWQLCLIYMCDSARQQSTNNLTSKIIKGFGKDSRPFYALLLGLTSLKFVVFVLCEPIRSMFPGRAKMVSGFMIMFFALVLGFSLLLPWLMMLGGVDTTWNVWMAVSILREVSSAAMVIFAEMEVMEQSYKGENIVVLESRTLVWKQIGNHVGSLHTWSTAQIYAQIYKGSTETKQMFKQILATCSIWPLIVAVLGVTLTFRREEPLNASESEIEMAEVGNGGSVPMYEETSTFESVKVPGERDDTKTFWVLLLPLQALLVLLHIPDGGKPVLDDDGNPVMAWGQAKLEFTPMIYYPSGYICVAVTSLGAILYVWLSQDTFKRFIRKLARPLIFLAITGLCYIDTNWDLVDKSVKTFKLGALELGDMINGLPMLITPFFLEAIVAGYGSRTVYLLAAFVTAFSGLLRLPSSNLIHAEAFAIGNQVGMTTAGGEKLDMTRAYIFNVVSQLITKSVIMSSPTFAFSCMFDAESKQFSGQSQRRCVYAFLNSVYTIFSGFAGSVSQNTKEKFIEWYGDKKGVDMNSRTMFLWFVSTAFVHIFVLVLCSPLIKDRPMTGRGRELKIIPTNRKVKYICISILTVATVVLFFRLSIDATSWDSGNLSALNMLTAVLFVAGAQASTFFFESGDTRSRRGSWKDVAALIIEAGTWGAVVSGIAVKYFRDQEPGWDTPREERISFYDFEFERQIWNVGIGLMSTASVLVLRRMVLGVFLFNLVPVALVRVTAATLVFVATSMFANTSMRDLPMFQEARESAHMIH